MNNSGVEYVHYGADAVTKAIKKEADINEEIADQAKKHELSKIKIANVVHAANHTLNNYLRKTASNKCYTMEKYNGPASVDKVMEFLSSKTASVTANAQDAAFDFINWQPAVKEAELQFPNEEQDISLFVKEATEDYERFLLTTNQFIKEQEHNYGMGLQKLASIANELEQAVVTEVMNGEDFHKIKEACSRVSKDGVEELFNEITKTLVKLGKYNAIKSHGFISDGNKMKTTDAKTGLKANMDIMMVDGSHPVMKLMDEFGTVKDSTKDLFEDINLGREAKEQLVKKIITLDTPEKIKQDTHANFMDDYKTVINNMEKKMNVKTSGVRPRFFKQAAGLTTVAPNMVKALAASGSNPGKNRVLSKLNTNKLSGSTMSGRGFVGTVSPVMKEGSLSNEMFWIGDVVGNAMEKAAFIGAIGAGLGTAAKAIAGGAKMVGQGLFSGAKAVGSKLLGAGKSAVNGAAKGVGAVAHEAVTGEAGKAAKAYEASDALNKAADVKEYDNYKQGSLAEELSWLGEATARACHKTAFYGAIGSGVKKVVGTGGKDGGGLGGVFKQLTGNKHVKSFVKGSKDVILGKQPSGLKPVMGNAALSLATKAGQNFQPASMTQFSGHS